MKSHHNQKITLYDIASNLACKIVANIEKGVSRFATTGIYLLVLEKYTNKDFAIQAITEQDNILLPIIENGIREGEDRTSICDISI